MDHSLESRLLAAKQYLHDKYDALNRAWQEAEELVISLNVGREVVIHLYEEDPGSFGHFHPDREGWNDADSIESGSWTHYLAFTKRLGEWRICYVSVPTGWEWNNDYAGEWKPILECSKEIRVDAANDLPKLLLAVIEEVEKIAGEAEDATRQLKSAIAPFRVR